MNKKFLPFLLLAAFILYGSLLSAQVLYNEGFDTAGEGVTGPQPATVTTPSGPWSVMGDFTGMIAGNDYFMTTTVSSEGLLEGQDTGGRVCFVSDPIDISAYASVDVSAVITEVGDHESSDYVDFILVVDGVEQAVTNYSGLGSATHALVGDKPNDSDFGKVTVMGSASGSSLVVKICVSNNAGSEKLRIDDVMVEVGTVAPPTPNVIISEINYNPIESGVDQTEFVELYNAEATVVRLDNWELTGVEYIFPEGSFIRPGEYVVVAGNALEFENLYGCSPRFEWGGGALSNNGETVSLLDMNQNVVDEVPYDDASPWTNLPDGNGPSLELTDLMADNSSPAFWAPSIVDGGTPGAPNQGTFTGCAPKVIAFYLVDSDDNTDLGPLLNGDVIDLSNLSSENFSVRVELDRMPGSVKMEGAGLTQTENNAPYALRGDNGGDYFEVDFDLGTYTITATPYELRNLQGTEYPSMSVTFTFIETLAPVSSFTLINADTDMAIGPLMEGDVIDIAIVGTDKFNIVANIGSGPPIGSVRFGFNGNPNYRTENKAAYALGGNSGNNFHPITFAPGSYTVSATPFKLPSGYGTMGVTSTVNFEVIDGGAATRHAKLDHDNFIKLFPNPTSESIVVEIEEKLEGNTVIEIFDMKGNKILQKMYTDQAANWKQRFSVEEYPTGMYSLTVRNGGKLYHRNFVKR